MSPCTNEIETLVVIIYGFYQTLLIAFVCNNRKQIVTCVLLCLACLQPLNLHIHMNTS